MRSEQQRLESIFDAAVPLTAERRESYLNRACAGEPELKRRVQALLRAHDRAGNFLQPPGQTDSSRPSAPRGGLKSS